MIETGQNINADHYIGTYTAGETIAAGDAVAYDHSDNKVYKASASAWAYRINFIGFAQSTATANNPVLVNTMEIVTEKTGLSAGSDYYLSDTQGAISTTAGTISRRIGRALSSTRLKRPKNGTPVSGFISRSFSGTTAFAHLMFYASSQGGRNLTVNSTTLQGDESFDRMAFTLILIPDDTVSWSGGTSGGGNGPLVRILDR